MTRRGKAPGPSAPGEARTFLWVSAALGVAWSAACTLTGDDLEPFVTSSLGGQASGGQGSEAPGRREESREADVGGEREVADAAAGPSCSRDEQCEQDERCIESRCRADDCDASEDPLACLARDCAPGQCPNDCSDGRLGVDESDVDCGGACPGCPAGGTCAEDADCAGGACVDAACRAPHCSDGRRNGGETDVDCGGLDCPGCGAGGACEAAEDCASGVCAALCGEAIATCCQEPTCSDGVQNGDEPLVDCGNDRCGPCSEGADCTDSAQCASGVCDEGRCGAPDPCQNGVVDQGESGVDCGGSSFCERCPGGLPCSVDGDCASQSCSAGSCDFAPTCDDGLRNGDESDVDCGGGVCPSCFDGRACRGPSDCRSDSCSSGVCVCGDGVQNGDESGVDCGEECGPCAPGEPCGDDDDCDSGICEAGRCCGGTGADCARCAERLAPSESCSRAPDDATEGQCVALLACLADNAATCTPLSAPACTGDPGGICAVGPLGGVEPGAVQIARAVLLDAGCDRF